jgi:hypothetical protein
MPGIISSAADRPRETCMTLFDPRKNLKKIIAKELIMGMFIFIVCRSISHNIIENDIKFLHKITVS